jgi:predicted Zn-dependent peptidase
MKVITRHLPFINKFIVITFISLSLVAATFAQGKINIADQVSLVTEFEVNGLKVLVKRRSNAPTVAAGLFIRGGSRNITDKNAGIESLTLESAIEASKNFPRDVVRRDLSNTGSGIGASVSNDYSVMNFASTRQHFERTWRIFTDLAMNPVFAEDDVERIRQQMILGLREEETNNDNFLEILQGRVIYADHPYANRVGGTIDTIEKLTPQDLRAYHKNIMQTSRLLLVVVGDIDADELRNNVASTLGKLPQGDYQEKPFPKFDFSKGTLDVIPRTLPTNYIRGIFEAPAINNPDYYAMRVAITLLQNQLFEEVREKRQLSYAPSASLDTFSANTANIYVTAVDANQTINVMLDEIKRLKRDLVPNNAISGVAGQFLTTYYLNQETNAAQVGELAKYELIGGGWKNSFEFLNQLTEVTPQDVREVSRKYMKNIRFVVIGNPIAINKEIFLQKMDW